MNGTGEQLSSASIFEHVDRMSRGADASKRLPNKVQLIAMQPMAVPPLHSAAATATANGKLSNANQINKEVQFGSTCRIHQDFSEVLYNSAGFE